MKTPGIRLTDAAKAMNADFRIAMTGTPVENRLSDLWCIVDGVRAWRANGPTTPAPGLDGLQGMAKAVAWGRAAARDLRAYAAGTLAWSEVDRGALLAGPPGTDKTTFAKRFAAECGEPPVATSYTEWSSAGREGHAGELMQCMRGRFAEARRLSLCVFFIEELDSIQARGMSKRHDDLAPQSTDTPPQ